MDFRRSAPSGRTREPPRRSSTPRPESSNRLDLIRLQRQAGNRATTAWLRGDATLPASPSVQRDGPAHKPTEAEQATNELHAIGESRARGEKIKPGREDEAKLKAIGAGQHIVDKMSHSDGNEMLAAVSELQRNLKDIKDARYRGYQDAIAFLSLKQFDDERHGGAQKGFLLSLAGNLLWALSGLIALTPAGVEARVAAQMASAFGKAANTAPMVSKLMSIYAAQRARLAVAAGTGGAMLAQFANGLPDVGTPGSQVSTSLTDAKQQFDALNEAMFQDLNLSIYDLMLVPLDIPLDAGVRSRQDAPHAVAQAMAVTRSVAFAGYAESGRIGEDGRISETGIAQDARDGLLRMWLQQAAGIRDGHIAATTTTAGPTGNKAGPKLVGSAVELLGGESKLGFGPYDMVTPKVTQAANTFGLKISPSGDGLAKLVSATLSAGKPFTVAPDAFDKKALSGDRLMWLGQSSALEWESLDTSGAVPPISKVKTMTLRPEDLSSMKVGDKTIFSVKQIVFDCVADYGGTENEYRFQDTQLKLHLDTESPLDGSSPLGAP